MASKVTGVRLAQGQRLTLQSPGGGGWGEARAREPERVARDVRNGLVSRESAREVYAAVLDEAGDVDAEGEADESVDDQRLLTVKNVVEEKQIPIAEMSVPAKIRLATLGNAFARATLIRDPIKLVSIAAIKSPGVTDLEAAAYARNQSLAEEVIRFIATRREWTKMYGVKVSLCRNPKPRRDRPGPPGRPGISTHRRAAPHRRLLVFVHSSCLTQSHPRR